MSTFTPTPDHGLSTAAQALSAERRENEVLLAELALGLIGLILTGDNIERAKTAVARQVNLQVKMADNGDIVAEGRGRQSITYAQVNGVRVALDSLAIATVRALLGPGPKSTAGVAEFRW